VATGIEHESPDHVILIHLADHLFRGLLGHFVHLPAQVCRLGMGRHERSRPHGIIGLRTAYGLHHLVEQLVHAAIGVGVLLGELGYGGAGLLHIGVDAEALAVLQGQGPLHLRFDVFDQVLIEIQVCIYRCIVHHHVVDGMGVVEEIRQGDLLGHQAAADLEPLLQQETFLPCLGEVRSDYQPVGATTDDDHIKLLSHFPSFSLLGSCLAKPNIQLPTL